MLLNLFVSPLQAGCHRDHLQNFTKCLISGSVWTRDAFVIKKKRRENIIGERIVDFPPSARADSRCG